MELRRHDIGVDLLPEQASDLIHARLVLTHVLQRHQALAKLVAALKPRGWLVIEEFDGRLIDRTIPMPDAAAASFKRVVGALAQLMDQRGFDAEWPRQLYGRLKAAGLSEVGMEGHLAVREGGSLGASLDAANYAQVRKEAVAKGRDRRRAGAPGRAGFRCLLASDVHGLGAAPGPCCQPIRSRLACQPTSRRTAPTKGHLP
jgi:Methyltransferase domain